MTIDGATGAYTVWQTLAMAGAIWPVPTRLSTRNESADWPSAAFAPDGSVALVGWTDDSANTSRVAVRAADGTWRRQSLGAGWWSSLVPLAAGGGVGAAGWPTVNGGNPNSASMVGRTWR